MNYYIKTFGCQMNVSDSERIAGFLDAQPHPNPLLRKEREFKATKDINEADLVIFNTCGVRQMAEDRVFGQIHNIRKQELADKIENKKIIILTGCLANRKDIQKKLKNKVDLFLPINNILEIKNLDLIKNLKLKIENSAQQSCEKSYLKITPKYTNTHTTYVPIMTGCNNFCSYCVVPYARGREVSRPVEEIISEIKNLIKSGYREIILLGQNVNSYSYELPELSSKHPKLSSGSDPINFPTLLKLIQKIPGKFWINFMSSHPKDYSDELIEVIAKSKKICELIHLPLQAGDDQVLRNMNRKYTQKHYLSLVKKIKSAFKKYKPEILYAITTDIIVGFPGETKKQFLESAEVMKKVKYDMVYFGQFSPRPGTVAYKMKDSVSKKEKVRREKYLNEILKETVFENNKKYVGKIIEILVDKEKNDFYFGRTRTGKNVKINLTPALSFVRRGSNRNLIGQFVKVKITKANTWNLEACLPKKRKEIIK